MGFAQIGFLIALSALAIPVVVHLLNRWQVRRIELGTMRFLQETISESAARRRIRRWLLLLTRAALLGLLAILFARPYFTEPGRRDGDRMRLVLVDRSASMAMPGRSGRLIDDALDAAERAVLELGDEARIVWAWFDRDVEELPETQRRRPAPPESMAGDTNYRAALRWARDKVNQESRARCDVLLVTDLQQSGFAAVTAAGETEDRAGLNFPADVPVRIVDVGRPAASNLAITNVSARGTILPPETAININATLFNYGALPMEEITVSATAVNGEETRRTKKTVNIPNEQAQEIGFDLGVLPAGTWQVTVDVDVEDDLAIDNRRRLALKVASPYQVLILDPGSEDETRSQTSYYLKTALDQTMAVASSEYKFKTRVDYLRDGVLSLQDDRYALVVVADAAGVLPAQISQLKQQVNDGTQLLMFAGGMLQSEIANAYQQNGLAPGKLQARSRAGVTPFRITPVSARGSMMKPFEDPQHGDLNRLVFDVVQDTDVDPTTTVHAWFDDQHPAITQHRLGKGRIVWFLSAADDAAGNWTTSPLYLPLVQQMVSELLGLTGEGPVRFRDVGEMNLERMTQQSDPSEGEFETAPGQRRFDTPGFRAQGNVTYIVNTPAKESDPTRRDAAALVDQYGLTAMDAGEDMETSETNVIKRSEIWPWLAAAALVFLVAEFSLANRTPA